MQFQKLEIENFLAITKAEVDLASRGLVLIQGINNRDSSAQSNGAGKSSIADALCWCWFGTTARGVTGDDVINGVAKKNTVVRSTVIDGGVTYTATRHRKHKTGKNSLQIHMHDGLRVTDLTKGTDKLTQEVADRIIGASLDVFSGAIYAGQERMPDLPAMTDKFLKMIIEEAAGLNVLERAYALARIRASAARSTVETLVRKQETLVEKRDLSRAHLAAIRADLLAWEDDRKRSMEMLRNEIADGMKDIANRVEAFKREHRQEPAIKDDLEKVNRQLSALDAQRKKAQELYEKMAEAEGRRAVAIIERGRAQQDEDRLRKIYESAKNRIGDPCSSCGQPLGEAELDHVIRQAGKDLEAAILRTAGAIKAAEDAESTYADAKATFDGFRIPDFNSLLSQRSVFEEELRLRNTVRDMIEVRKAAIQKMVADLNTEKAKQNPFCPQETRSLKEIEDLDRMIAEDEKDILEKKAFAEVENQVMRVFGPTGVRARILDEVTPFLNAQTSKYLAVLSDGNIAATWSTITLDAKGNPKERFSIDVTNATGAGIFKGLSGGEKRKVRLACALALQDLVATRATKPIDLFIADEVDTALDVSGLERLMEVLTEKAKERGSVFVISHNDLKDWISKVITIEKTASGETKIAESN